MTLRGRGIREPPQSSTWKPTSFLFGGQDHLVLTSSLSLVCLFFFLETSTDRKVPVPLRGRLIPERVGVGSLLKSALWKVTADGEPSLHLSAVAEHWLVTAPLSPQHFSLRTSRSAPQSSPTSRPASQWQRHEPKDH